VPEPSRVAVFKRGGAMFSNLWSVVGFLAWAEQYNYTPVVQFRDEKPSNRWIGDPNRDGWTDYFNPVTSVDLVEGSSVRVFSERPTAFPIHEYSSYPEYVRIFEQYISLNAQTEDYVRPWLEALTGYPSVLGMHIRGTDMKVAKSHLAPPTFFQIRKVVDLALDRVSFAHLLVSTEDDNALRFVKRRYGGRVLTTDSIRTSQTRKLVHLGSSIPQYRYFLGLQVLRDAWLLAHCGGFVSGHSNVSEHVQVIAPRPFQVNLQIRRPRVDVAGSAPAQIAITNLLRNLTTSRFEGPDFRIIDRSATS